MSRVLNSILISSRPFVTQMIQQQNINDQIVQS